jgi:hypothetical protein
VELEQMEQDRQEQQTAQGNIGAALLQAFEKGQG